MTNAVSTLACAGCGAPAGPDALADAFRCARAAARPDADHLICRTLDTTRVRIADGDRDNPFLRYRHFLHSYQLAVEHGMSDANYVALVGRLDTAIARVDGRGFRVTPLVRSADLERHAGVDAGGAVWIKDETRNVSGSHKARHLMGVMLYLEVVQSLGIDEPRRRDLALASCGNAALAAAVVAAAAGYHLRVFVPVSADRSVVDRIRALGAEVERCPRRPGAVGDPAYLRFREAIAGGALPFCCQGNENGLTIEGGETLGFEIAEALEQTPAQQIVVQVGGGALASSCVQAFEDIHAVTGAQQPRLFTVQTRGAYPLKRAFDSIAERWKHEPDGAAAIDAVMRYARTHRSAFMRPWEIEPRSVAHGILDDETYDWAVPVEAMLRTDGAPLVVGEDELHQANRMARAATTIDVDQTGSAGLAGLMQLLERQPSSRRQTTVVIFSGIRR